MWPAAVIAKGYADREAMIENDRQLHLIRQRSLFLDSFHCQGRLKESWCLDCSDRWEELGGK